MPSPDEQQTADKYAAVAKAAAADQSVTADAARAAEKRAAALGATPEPDEAPVEAKPKSRRKQTTR